MIYLTLGDPNSVNIEIVLKSLKRLQVDNPLVIVGSYAQFQIQASALKIKPPSMEVVHSIDEIDQLKSQVMFLDIGTAAEGPANRWNDTERGELAWKSLQMIEKIDQTKPFAVVTAPINKKSMSLAGFDFPGHTEYFQHMWREEAVMLLAGEKLRVGLVTNHLPLQNVSKYLSIDLIYRKAIKLQQALQSIFGVVRPQIAVTGLNPHCSDGGLFGYEEESMIVPAIEKLKERGVNVNGPVPADTAFYMALEGQYDAVLAMYHDQGLGPFKTVCFDQGVNISAGLPHLRVSPDHGPAADLFLKNEASDTSMALSLQLANDYLNSQYKGMD